MSMTTATLSAPLIIRPQGEDIATIKANRGRLKALFNDLELGGGFRVLNRGARDEAYQIADPDFLASLADPLTEVLRKPRPHEQADERRDMDGDKPKAHFAKCTLTEYFARSVVAAGGSIDPTLGAEHLQEMGKRLHAKWNLEEKAYADQLTMWDREKAQAERPKQPKQEAAPEFQLQ